MLSRHVCFWPLFAVALACAPSKGPKEPNSAPSVSPGLRQSTTEGAEAEHSNQAEVLALLPSSKLTLLQGIALGEQRSGVAISAKFEVEDGKLPLSVYTARNGIEPDAEHNVLAELAGDPTGPEWQPKEEIFSDAPHIKRASMHLTVLQRARTNLSDIVAKALAKQPGNVYSVTPDVVDGKPKFHVAVAIAGGKSTTVDIEGS